MVIYENIQDAYLNSVSKVIQDGEMVSGINDILSIGSNFGTKQRDYLELINHSFMIRSPQDKTIKIINRKINYSYAFANIIWVLTFQNDVKFITRYNPNGIKFSDDGVVINGSTGYRIGNSSFNAVINKLKQDSTSRRAVLAIFSNEDLEYSSVDIPCNISFQYILRNGRLHAITNMRSQSVAFMLPYDLILYTFIQEVIATLLGVNVGNYYHNSSSFHIYEDELNQVKNLIIDENIPNLPLYTGSMVGNVDFFDAVKYDIDNDCDQIDDQYWLTFKNIIRFG